VERILSVEEEKYLKRKQLKKQFYEKYKKD
jgi:hypothetical protein